MQPISQHNSSVTKKRYLFDSVYSQTQLSKQYLLQLIFSTIITTLGLLTNNTVVVIGAMIISPLFWPVMGIALGVITSRKHILQNSFISLFFSVFIVVFFSALITLMVPISELSQEITSRMNPNIIDLFIALATSIIGVLALYYPTISSTATGVALSISLLPPLSLVGVGIARLSLKIVGKSLLLFGTNMGAIIFVGVIVLYILKIGPRKVEEEIRFKYGVLISGLIMLMLSIPLSIYLKESIYQNKMRTGVELLLTQEIQQTSNNARIERVNIDFLSLRGKKPVDIEAIVYLPEGVYMTQFERENLVDKISNLTGSDVNLNFNIVSTLSLQSEEDLQKSLARKSIVDLVSKEIKLINNEISIDNINVVFPNEANLNELSLADIVISIKQYGDVALTIKDVENIKVLIRDRLGYDANIQVDLLPISRLKESTLLRGTYAKIESGIKSILVDRTLDETYDVVIDDLSINNNLVTLTIFVPEQMSLVDETQDELEKFIEEVLQTDIILKLHVVRYE